jgi:6-phosphogluconolactonase
MKMQTIIVEDKNKLARTGADLMIAQAQAAFRENRQFSIALSGGSTPAMMYKLLAEAPLDWANIHLFWSDERCVPPDHPESNYRMAFESLISHINIPLKNVHRIFGEIPPDLAGDQYEQELHAFFGMLPRFDLILLGLGEDGHTASLFPTSPAVNERSRWVTAVPHDVPPLPLVTRVTLTLPILNQAHQVIFLVSGKGKAARLAEVLNTPEGSTLLPASMVRPDDGELLWLMDQAAAEKLENK